MKVTNKFNIHLDNYEPTSEIVVMQCDANVRELQFSLYVSNSKWQPPSSAKVYISYRKPDNTGGFYDVLPDGSAACTVNDNIITAILAEQVLTVPGKVQVAISIQADNKALATFAVQLNVKSNPGIGAVQSEDYFCLRAAIEAAVAAAQKPVHVITVNDNEDGTYRCDHDMADIEALINANVPIACYWYDESVMTYLTVFQSGELYDFSAVWAGYEYRIQINQKGVFCTVERLVKTSDLDASGGTGKDGITPHIGANGNWFIGETDTGMPSRGEPGSQGPPGKPYELTPEDKEEIATLVECTGGGLSVTDDGNGNVVIKSTGSVSITDDGDGNVTIA